MSNGLRDEYDGALRNLIQAAFGVLDAGEFAGVVIQASRADGTSLHFEAQYPDDSGTAAAFGLGEEAAERLGHLYPQDDSNAA